MIVTNAELEPEDPTRTERAIEAARVLIAGHPQGAIRRIMLYAIVIPAVLVASTGGTVGLAAAIVANACVTLLALTDQLA